MPGEPFAPSEPHYQGGQPMGAEAGEHEGEQGGEHHEGGRRRRRRGRRGGRRNRRRNGEQGFQPNTMNVPDSGNFEPGLDNAVADLDRPPAQAFAPEPPRHEPQASAPPQTAEQAEAAEARRRSTVRESVGSPSPTLPPPKPVISSTGSEEGTPKRGWWRRPGSDKE